MYDHPDESKEGAVIDTRGESGTARNPRRATHRVVAHKRLGQCRVVPLTGPNA